MTQFDRAGFSISRTALFATPVAIAEIRNGDDLVDELRSIILKREAEHPGLKRSNEGGWHSDTKMLEWGGAAARFVIEKAAKIAQTMSAFGDGQGTAEWTACMWANINSAGSLNLPHTHPGALWSAVFYIDVGGDDVSKIGGELILEDPRLPMANIHNPEFRFIGPDGQPVNWTAEIHPKRGMLVVFPSWMRHSVRTYRGNSRRISMAMDLSAQMPPA